MIGRSVAERRDWSAALLWPRAEELAVAFDESVALKLREMLAVFVRLALPHAKYCIAIRAPEAVDEPRVVLEMIVERCPLCSDRSFHGDESPGGLCCAVGPSHSIVA